MVITHAFTNKKQFNKNRTHGGWLCLTVDLVLVVWQFSKIVGKASKKNPGKKKLWQKLVQKKCLNCFFLFFFSFFLFFLWDFIKIWCINCCYEEGLVVVKVSVDISSLSGKLDVLFNQLTDWSVLNNLVGVWRLSRSFLVSIVRCVLDCVWRLPTNIRWQGFLVPTNNFWRAEPHGFQIKGERNTLYYPLLPFLEMFSFTQMFELFPVWLRSFFVWGGVGLPVTTMALFLNKHVFPWIKILKKTQEPCHMLPWSILNPQNILTVCLRKFWGKAVDCLWQEGLRCPKNTSDQSGGSFQ